MQTNSQAAKTEKNISNSPNNLNSVTPERKTEDDLFSKAELMGFNPKTAKRNLNQALSEIRECIREKKWEDAVSLFHPIEEKIPELIEYDLDVELREKIGFVLGQLKKYDDAIVQFSLCLEKDPDNFHLHNSLAYTAYNSVYAAKNREIFLSGKLKENRIRLAHRHFDEAIRIRPEGVTNYYRKGMLYKQIEGKTDRARPLFEQAINNWEKLGPEEKEARNQEQKNYIKSLYQYASSLLEKGQGKASLSIIKRCLSEDEKTGYLVLNLKYYALGKVNYFLNAYTAARDALLFAMQSNSGRPEDFVCELLARTYLALGNPERAMEVLAKIPERMRRPYFRWTEADTWLALDRASKAKEVLLKCLDKDTRSKHKTLIRLARIDYLLDDFQGSFKHAEEAGRFYSEKWGNILDDSLFWCAVSAYRLGNTRDALKYAAELKAVNPRYPKLRLLLKKLEEQ